MKAATMKAATIRSAMTTSRRRFQAACSAVTLASCGVVCASSSGPARQIAGLSLIGAFAGAAWFLRRERFEAVVPVAGLTLAFLILAGLALAAVHALNTVPVALAVGAVTLAAAWAGGDFPTPGHTGFPAPRHAERTAWLTSPNPLAVTGVLIFAAAAVLAVRYSADSATADADGSSSVALWAYPSDGRLHVGIQQSPGHGAASLRIVVTRAGVTVATWNDIRLGPGQTWQAPALAVTGDAPADIVALHGATVIASLSSR